MPVGPLGGKGKPRGSEQIHGPKEVGPKNVPKEGVSIGRQIINFLKLVVLVMAPVRFVQYLMASSMTKGKEAQRLDTKKAEAFDPAKMKGKVSKPEMPKEKEFIPMDKKVAEANLKYAVATHFGRGKGREILEDTNKSGKTSLVNALKDDVEVKKQVGLLLKSDVLSEKARLHDDGYIYDPQTGLHVDIILKDKKTGEVIIAFGGTKSEPVGELLKKQLKANISQLVGGVPSLYKQAANIATVLASKFGEDKVTTVGNSLGGGMAQFAALMSGTKGVGFNASRMGRGLQREISKKMGRGWEQEAKKYINNFSVKGDWLSHAKLLLPSSAKRKISRCGAGISFLRNIGMMLGMVTRKNVGVKYVMKPHVKGLSTGRRHGYFIQPFLQALEMREELGKHWGKVGVSFPYGGRPGEPGPI